MTPSPRLLAAILLALTPIACTSHAPPTEALPDEVLLRYPDGEFRLRQDVKADAVGTGVAAGESHVDETGVLDVRVLGGELKVSRRVTELRHVDMFGALVPKSMDGKRELDAAAVLAAATAQIVDMHGEVDKDASAALPENADADPDDPIMGALGLPERLPTVPLKLGIPIKTTRTDHERFGSEEIELTTTTTHTLLRVDRQDGRRLAEVTVTSESSDAQEITLGKVPVMLTIDKQVTGTLVFDIDARLPVRSTVTGTYTTSAGSLGTNEFKFKTTSTFTPT